MLRTVTESSNSLIFVKLTSSKKTSDFISFWLTHLAEVMHRTSTLFTFKVQIHHMHLRVWISGFTISVCTYYRETVSNAFKNVIASFNLVALSTSLTVSAQLLLLHASESLVVTQRYLSLGSSVCKLSKHFSVNLCDWMFSGALSIQEIGLPILFTYDDKWATLLILT